MSAPRRKPEELELPPATIVTDDRALARLMEDLDGQESIAVDTEADSFFSYREKVCLVQVTVEDRDYLVDPLAEMDLTPFGKMLADPSKEKIFHDGEYDILIFKREYDFEFANLFDTRVAAAALGMQAPGLASVLGEFFGVELDKSMQRSDWGKRPLSDKQISYARLDTHFLIPLRDKMRAELDERELSMVLDSECVRLEGIEPPDTSFDPDSFVRIKGSRTLSPKGRSALRELNVERDALAHEGNVPPFRIVNNPALLAIAEKRPGDRRGLVAIHGFSDRQANRFGDRMLDALARSEQNGPIDRLPRLPAKDGTTGFSEEQTELHERLKLWRKKRAEKMGFDASLLVNRHALLRLAQADVRSIDDIEKIEGLADWQLDQFGSELVDLHREFASDLKSGKIDLSKKRRRR